jgi:hypothetical protein
VNEENKYYQPLFKFLEPQFINGFLDGDLYLSNIKDFRKNIDPAQIYDENEGIIFFNGFEPDPTDSTRICMLKKICDPAKKKGILIFCAVKSILSESLSWAIRAHRLKCCLIASPRKVVDSISDNNGLTFIGRSDCNYTGRDFYDTQGANSNELLFKSLFTKPLEYKGQMEHRICWFTEELNPKSRVIKTKGSSRIIKVEVVPSYSICRQAFKRKKLEISRVELKVYDADKELLVHAALQYTVDLFTPIVYENEYGEFIGFSNPEPTFLGYASVNGGGVLIDSGIMLIGCVELSRVAFIKYTIL